jgi:hypothetical protein
VFLNRRGIRVVSSEKQQNLGPFSLENFNLAFISVGLLLDHYHYKTTSTDGSCFLIEGKPDKISISILFVIGS